MTFRDAWVAAIFAVFAGAPALAQQPAETAEPRAPAPDSATAQGEMIATPATPPAAPAAADAAKTPAEATKMKRADNDALLRAQAAGYKLVTKDGKEVFCKKEMVTGSRLATRCRSSRLFCRSRSSRRTRRWACHPSSRR